MTLFKKLIDSILYDKPIRKGCNIWTHFRVWSKICPCDIAMFTINIIKMLQLCITARKSYKFISTI